MNVALVLVAFAAVWMGVGVVLASVLGPRLKRGADPGEGWRPEAITDADRWAGEPIRWIVPVSIVVMMLGSSTGLAAAGALPAEVQIVARSVLGTVGLRVPDPPARPRATPETAARAPSAGAPARGDGQGPAASPGEGQALLPVPGDGAGPVDQAPPPGPDVVPDDGLLGPGSAEAPPGEEVAPTTTTSTVVVPPAQPRRTPSEDDGGASPSTTTTTVPPTTTTTDPPTTVPPTTTTTDPPTTDPPTTDPPTTDPPTTDPPSTVPPPTVPPTTTTTVPSQAAPDEQVASDVPPDPTSEVTVLPPDPRRRAKEDRKA